MCQKIPYPTGARARAALANTRRYGSRGDDDRKPVRVYHCPHCHKFHLTGDPH